MYRRTVRIACLVIGLLATAGLAYRTLQDEDTLARERQAAAADAAAVRRSSRLTAAPHSSRDRGTAMLATRPR